jgi:hypothetical protein
MVRKKNTAATVPVTGRSLVEMLGSSRAGEKVAGSGGTVLREGDTILVTGRSYITRTGTIETDEIYYVDHGIDRPGEGKLLGEADKVAWLDPATGYECIMMRATDGGYLSGYVGIPKDHPLWGWKYEAIPVDLGIEVHGGLTYAKTCQEGPTPERRLAEEARRICHVTRGAPRYTATQHATDYRVHEADAWWFGFDCDHAYDVVPNAPKDRLDHFLATEIGGEYRDDGYVYREVRSLAAQLRAIADGDPVPTRDGPPLPPISLDPGAGDQ